MAPVARDFRLSMRAALCLICLTLWPLGAGAADVALCDTLPNERERTACYSSALHEADRELNETYRQLMNELADDYKRILVRQAQIAWKRFRDAQCDLEAYPYRGGPLYGSMRDRCLARAIQQRDAELSGYRTGP